MGDTLPSHRHRVLDRLGQNEVQDRAGDEDGGEVGGKVMMHEKLSVHEVEWEVVERPSSDEESGRVEESISDF